VNHPAHQEHQAHQEESLPRLLRNELTGINGIETVPGRSDLFAVANCRASGQPWFPVDALGALGALGVSHFLAYVIGATPDKAHRINAL
jgi:hypothetical protein